MCNSADIEVKAPASLTIKVPNGQGVSEYNLDMTKHAMSQWASKFGVPPRYIKELADKDSDHVLNDLSIEVMNVHNKLHAKDILVRGILGDPDILGFNAGDCRAILSPSYGFIENYDVLTAVFEGLRIAREKHNISFEPGQASISDTNMRARINMPQLQMVADELLKNYRSPWSGVSGTDNPIVFVGIDIRNSEVGAGSFTLAPVIVMQVCDNGMTLTKDIFRKVHLGSASDSGMISSRTMQAHMNLITSQTIDKVVEIGTPEFLQAKVEELQGLKRPVAAKKVQDYLTQAFSEEHANAIFDDFIAGGDISAFGVAQAITSVSQKDIVPTNDSITMDDTALEHANQALQLI